MRGFSIKIIKHLPYQMATLYFILFVISIVASLITVNCGDEVFKTYTSCNGSKIYNINWVGIVIILQILFLFVSVEPKVKKPKEKEEFLIDIKKNQSPSKINFNLRESMSIYPKGKSKRDVKVKINPVKKLVNKREENHELEKIYEEEQEEINEKEYKDEHNSQFKKNIKKVKEVIKKKFKICWSSIWMLSYNFVIFMGVHGSVLASRIHANISLNKYGIETCQHLNYVPLNLSSPYLNSPILSEPVFLTTYLSFTIHEIVIRKTENSFLIKNFFGRHYFKESILIGSIRLILQIVLFVTNISIIILCVKNGFGSPMHVLVGFSISMLALWVNSLLSQLLELTHYDEMRAPTLEYSYIWSVLSGLVLWFCGFFYYTSVYGVPYKRIYFYLNPISLILLITLTYYKRFEIFNSSQYLKGFIPALN